jgi:hypothetical protein
MRAALLKSVGIRHPLHEVAEELFLVDDDDEENENIMSKSLESEDTED